MSNYRIPLAVTAITSIMQLGSLDFARAETVRIEVMRKAADRFIVIWHAMTSRINLVLMSEAIKLSLLTLREAN